MLIAYYVGTVAIRTISYIIETEVYRAKIERNINAFFFTLTYNGEIDKITLNFSHQYCMFIVVNVKCDFFQDRSCGVTCKSASTTFCIPMFFTTAWFFTFWYFTQNPVSRSTWAQKKPLLYILFKICAPKLSTYIRFSYSVSFSSKIVACCWSF